MLSGCLYDINGIALIMKQTIVRLTHNQIRNKIINKDMKHRE